MFLLPDPSELRAIASRITAHAVSVRGAADRVRHTLAVTRWTGFAADAFDVQARSVVSGLLGCAGRLDDAANALRAHADTVAHVLAVLQHLEHDALDLGSMLGHGLVDEVLHPTDLVGDTAGLLGSAGRTVGDLGHLIGIG